MVNTKLLPINHVLEHAVQHEPNYTCTQGTNVQAEQMDQATLLLNTDGGEMTTFIVEQAQKLKHHFNLNIRKHVRNSTRKLVQDELEHACGLKVPGQLLTLATKEQQDML